ncbi:MAG: hypothetical protein M3Q31_10535 [Actinomycetota bacterium]|nr:hypothetical protein [Actinomycetota bacterium]
MDLMLLRTFQRQVVLQCQAVLVGSHEFNSAMTTGDMTHVWIAIQNILGAAANISKALWGQGGKFAKEREPLRASLQVDDTSPLRNVAMRNHFEHFDERIDKWWDTSESHNLLDRSIMPPSAVEGLADIEMFRVFDPSTADIVFWGQRFNVNEIVREAARLLPIASVEAAKPHWDPLNTSGSGQ